MPHRTIFKLDDATAAHIGAEDMDDITMSKPELLALLQQTAKGGIASASQVISALTSSEQRQPASQQATTAYTNTPQQVNFDVAATDSSVFKHSSGPAASTGQSDMSKTMQNKPASRPAQTTDQPPQIPDLKMLKALKTQADKSINARLRVYIYVT